MDHVALVEYLNQFQAPWFVESGSGWCEEDHHCQMVCIRFEKETLEYHSHTGKWELKPISPPLDDERFRYRLTELGVASVDRTHGFDLCDPESGMADAGGIDGRFAGEIKGL